MKSASVLFFNFILLFLLIAGLACADTVRFTSQTPLMEQNPDAEMIPEPEVQVPTAAVSQRYIVLKNGSILFGDVKLIGNQYEITTSTGTLTVSQLNVTQIAESLRQIYNYRVSQVFINDLEGRCELIRWCLQYELVPEAEEQMELLKKYAPEHALVEVFERRITFLKNKKERETVQKSESKERETIETEVLAPAGRPTRAELQQMAESMPEDSIEIFRKKIQPILQRSCMTSECHGPNSQNEFQLMRIYPQMARGEVLQNIHAVLNQVNLAHPELSPFLRKPVTPHGTDGRTIFVNQDYATYQLLIAWTYLVAQNRYVIPRERLLPPQKSAPVYTPTQRGLVRISSHSVQEQVGPCQMWGVDASLFPQNLFPQEYTKPGNPTGKAYVMGGVVAGNPAPNSGEPQIRLVLPKHENEMKLESPNDGMEQEPEVVPASAETDSEVESDSIQQVSAEEPGTKPSKTQNNGIDWKAVVNSFGEALGETPDSSTDSSTNPSTGSPTKEGTIKEVSSKKPQTQNSLSEEETSQIQESEDVQPQEIQLPVTGNSTPQYYSPGQSTMEGPTYAPGQNSISRVYAPGQSSASKLRRGNPTIGVTASPVRIPAPKSPAELMSGRDSVEHGGGSYYYDASNAGNVQNTNSNGTHVWEQMLEMQGGPSSLKEKN